MSLLFGDDVNKGVKTGLGAAKLGTSLLGSSAPSYAAPSLWGITGAYDLANIIGSDAPDKQKAIGALGTVTNLGMSALSSPTIANAIGLGQLAATPVTFGGAAAGAGAAGAASVGALAGAAAPIVAGVVNLISHLMSKDAAAHLRQQQRRAEETGGYEFYNKGLGRALSDTGNYEAGDIQDQDAELLAKTKGMGTALSRQNQSLPFVGKVMLERLKDPKYQQFASPDDGTSTGAGEDINNPNIVRRMLSGMFDNSDKTMWRYLRGTDEANRRGLNLSELMPKYTPQGEPSDPDSWLTLDNPMLQMVGDYMDYRGGAGNVADPTRFKGLPRVTKTQTDGTDFEINPVWGLEPGSYASTLAEMYNTGVIPDAVAQRARDKYAQALEARNRRVMAQPAYTDTASGGA